MNGLTEQKPMPKAYCMVTLIFPITGNEQALHVKEVIDHAIKDVKDKRYTFQIVDNE